MSIPTINDTNKLDFVFEGSPFARGSSKPGVDTLLLDFVFEGSPIVGNPDTPLGAVDATEIVAVADSPEIRIVHSQQETPEVQDTGAVSANVTAEEEHPISDLPDNQEVPLTEEIATADSIFVDVVATEETIGVQDDAIVQATNSAEESAEVADSAVVSSVVPNSETTGIQDSTAYEIGVSPIENADVTDSFNIIAGPLVTNSEAVGATDTVFGSQDLTWEDTIKIELSALATAEDTVHVPISPYEPVPVTDYTSPSNVFTPTIWNGSYIQQNGSTDPGASALAGVPLFININKSGMFGVNNCGILGFNVTIGPGGGSWSMITSALVASSGQTFTLSGLRASCTREGRGISNQGPIYISGGIFGNPMLNAPLQLVARTSQALGPVLASTVLPPGSKNWSTVSAAANAIASAASIQFSWMAPDCPLTDLGVESGSTVGGALQALAARVGANLVWNGDNGYIVVQPDKALGSWTVPHCSLLLPNGAQYVNLRDIQPHKAVIMPVNVPTRFGGEATFFTDNVSQGFAKPSPTFQATPEKVVHCGSVGKRLTADDPVHWFPLDQDYKRTNGLRIQILSSTAGGANVTQDPNNWFAWAGPISTRSDGTRWVGVSSADFPADGTNAAIDDGRFQLNVGFIRDNEAEKNAFISSYNNNTTKNKSLLAQELESLRFIQTMEGSINCLFFGSLPLPQMIATATGDSITVQGLVQGATLSAPGFVSVDLADFTKLNFFNPRIGMNVGNAGTDL